MTFRSTGIRPEGENFLLDGDLTLHGVTKQVTFFLEVNGFGPDPYGGTRTGFSATTEINRNDWEVSYNGPIPGATNAMVLSDKVTINLEIEAVLHSGE
jgi:polyisoprenoid-binding protein YceI